MKKLHITNPDETTSLDVIKDVNKNNKLNHELIVDIFNSLPLIGIYNPVKLLNILVDVDKHSLNEFINNDDNISRFIYNVDYIKNMIYVVESIDMFKEKNKCPYIINTHIKKGTFHDIFKVLNVKNKNHYAIRKQLDIELNDLYDSCSDFFIHCILSLYQGKILINHSHYRGNLIIPKIIHLGTNQKKNKMLGVISLFKGTLFQILISRAIKSSIKIRIIFNCMYQIAYYLEHLQTIFKFNHNDLKVNNIFYSYDNYIEFIDKDKIKYIKFFIGDFGFSRIKIINPITQKKVKLIGGALLSYSNNKKLYSFIPGKDLYFLAHNIYVYSTDDIKKELLEFFSLFNDFNVGLTIKNKWFEIYDDCESHEKYTPTEFLKILKSSKFYKYIHTVDDLINKELLNNNIKIKDLIKKNPK